MPLFSLILWTFLKKYRPIKLKRMVQNRASLSTKAKIREEIGKYKTDIHLHCSCNCCASMCCVWWKKICYTKI